MSEKTYPVTVFVYHDRNDQGPEIFGSEQELLDHANDSLRPEEPFTNFDEVSEYFSSVGDGTVDEEFVQVPVPRVVVEVCEDSHNLDVMSDVPIAVLSVGEPDDPRNYEPGELANITGEDGIVLEQTFCIEEPPVDADMVAQCFERAEQALRAQEGPEPR